MMIKSFSSEKGFILTMAGAIIGLGNIWRFPHLVANYGGGLFLALYLFLLISVGYFLLLGEISLGKSSRKTITTDTDEVEEEEKEIPAPTLWKKWVSGLGLSCAFMMNIVYTIIMGWILYFFAQTFLELSGMTNELISKTTFLTLTNNFEVQLFWSFISILCACFFLGKGSLKSIEKLSTVFIPALFFILLYMILWILTNNGAKEGVAKVFEFNWEAIGFSAYGIDFQRLFQVLIAALSQVIYSLSIGMGVAYIYGTYISKSVNIVAATRYVVILDTLFSILSAIFIMAISNAFNVPGSSDSSLTFVSLPIAFEQMFAGSFLMFLFYGCIFIAALTTLISLYEPLICFVRRKLRLSTTPALTLVSGLNLAFIAIVLLSSSNIIQIDFLEKNLFHSLDSFTNTMLLISVFVISVFIGWFKFDSVHHTIRQAAPDLSQRMTNHIQLVFKFIAPAILVLLILNELLKF